MQILIGKFMPDPSINETTNETARAEDWNGVQHEPVICEPRDSNPNSNIGGPATHFIIYLITRIRLNCNLVYIQLYFNSLGLEKRKMNSFSVAPGLNPSRNPWIYWIHYVRRREMSQSVVTILFCHSCEPIKMCQPLQK